MRTLFLVYIMVMMGLVVPTFANELENEATVTNQQIAAAKDLPKTLVVRRDSSSNSVSVLHSEVNLDASTSSFERVRVAEFVTMKANERMRKELDRDGSKSSWFFFFNPFFLTNSFFYTPTYLYSGFAYNYTPYYSFYNSPYTYSYYRWWY